MLCVLLAVVLTAQLLPVTALAALADDKEIVSVDKEIVDNKEDIPADESKPEVSPPADEPKPEVSPPVAAVLTSSPNEIPAGTVDPVVTITANVGLTDFAGSGLTVDSGETGLTLSGADLKSGSALVVKFQGTAKPGIIKVSLPGDAFQEPGNAAPALAYIRIAESEQPEKPAEPAGVVTPVLTVSPCKIPAGTVDPTFVVASSVEMQDCAGNKLSVSTGETGLALTDAEYDLKSRTVVLHFRGTAKAGTITGNLPASAFWHKNADVAGASFSIQIEKEEQEGYYVVFAANNGKEPNKFAHIGLGKSIFLPECMFGAPGGKVFAGWRIHDKLYSPGDRYNVQEDTVITACWADAEDDRISTVVDRIEKYVENMTDEEKKDPDAIDLATLYAENVCAEAATREVDGAELRMCSESISDLAAIAEAACTAAEAALSKGGVTPARELFRTATLKSTESDISVYLAGDVTSAGVDKLCAKARDFDLTFKKKDVADDLGKGMTVTAKNVGRSRAPNVKVDLPNGSTTNSVTLSIPATGNNQVIQSSDRTTQVSKMNPVTKKIEGKINTSGTYSSQTSQKDFSDISKKSSEMQTAIRYLASSGIIDGTTKTTFSPDLTISRAEIAKLIVASLGKLNKKAIADFTDVTKKDWYYAAAASSQKHGIVKGFEDRTFRGRQTINKVQIVAVTSRVLVSEMKYKMPGNPNSYLAKYSDSVPKWAQSEVALATRENLVIRRQDGTFSGTKNMTRGDAAMIIYRLFQRIW